MSDKVRLREKVGDIGVLVMTPHHGFQRTDCKALGDGRVEGSVRLGEAAFQVEGPAHA